MKLSKFQEKLSFILIAAIAGGVAGAITSKAITSNTVGNTNGGSATSTQVEVPRLIRIEPETIPQRIPPKDLILRESPVATVYRRILLGTPEARTLDDNRLLGQAISLTSDGWFVTVDGVVSGLSPSDLTLWHEGELYHAERIVTDSINNTAFIKVDARNLPSPPFSSIDDLLVGAESWLERRPGELESALLHSINLDTDDDDPESSEVAFRRLGATTQISSGDLGAPLWDSRGALIGLVVNKEGWASIVPSNSIDSSLGSLLSNSEISHAGLGVTARDLSAWRIDGDRGTLPEVGALVTGLEKGGVAAAAGIKLGDVILQVERDILDGTADIGEVLSEFQPNTEVTIRLLREGDEQMVTVTLDSNITSKEIK